IGWQDVRVAPAMPMFLWLPTESAAFIRPISQCRRIDRFAPNRSTKADAWLGQSWVILDRIGLSRHVRFPPVSEHGANIAGCLKRANNGYVVTPSTGPKCRRPHVLATPTTVGTAAIAS